MILSPAKLRLAVNLGSSYANVFLMALITLLVVPIYVRTLGAGQWGIVALCMTLQGALHAVDVALSPLMLRDVARSAAGGSQAQTYARFRRIYGALALGLFCAGQLLVLALQHSPLPGWAPISSELAWALRLALVQFALQFANNAALGYWNGLERQRFANVRVAAYLLAKHASALLLVSLCWSSAIAYLLPFVVIGAIEWLQNHRRVQREGSHKSASDGVRVGSDWSDPAAFAFAAAIGVLCTQIDRIYLSLALSAEQYGVYFLVSNLMLSLLSLQVPIQRAFLPRIATASAAEPDAAAMLKTSALLLVLPCLLLATLAEPLLICWLRDPVIAAAAAPTLRWMLVATALIALYAPTFAQWLSQRRYRLIGLLNSLILLTQWVLLSVYTPRLGMLAGALAWLGFGALQAASAALWWRYGRHGAAPANLV